jgi:hypothetical protein
VQPGSLESESGIFAAAFDVTGSRLVTAEADKTIKASIVLVQAHRLALTRG